MATANEHRGVDPVSTINSRRVTSIWCPAALPQAGVGGSGWRPTPIGMPVGDTSVEISSRWPQYPGSLNFNGVDTRHE